MEKIRLGFIGIGDRGTGLLRLALRIEGFQVTALCDIHPPHAERARDLCAKYQRGSTPRVFTEGDTAYRRLLECDDVDAVIIATPWSCHTPQALDAMNSGKHAFVEVPAAITVEDCWRLVETAEASQRHCMMMENVCYGEQEMMALNMCRQGVFGELLHGEGAYIHDLRYQMKDGPHGTGGWRTAHHARRNGNFYPTHGLGPIAQYMNINRGDRFDYLVSMSSPARGRAEYARKNLPEGHPFRDLKYVCGDINNSLIKTSSGRSILVQYDTTTPRPYSRINLIQGTEGMYRSFPQEQLTLGTHKKQNLRHIRKQYQHPLWHKRGPLARKLGGHGGMDALMLWRIAYCLRHGEPLDQDVYDAASWSAICPLSEASVAARSKPIDIPDFTRGQWKTMKPLAIAT